MKPIRKTIQDHVELLKSGALSHFFGFKIGYRLLLLFEDEKMAKKTRSYLQSQPSLKPFYSAILIGYAPDTLKDISQKWSSVD
jgi:hypothetical protein